MGDLSAVFRVAVRAGALMDAAELRWVIGGGIAATLHGSPRPLDVVEIALELPPQRIEPLMQALSAEFYVDRQSLLLAVRDRTTVSLIHPGTMVRVELAVLRDDPLSQRQLQRREFFRAYGSEDILPVTSAEDTVLAALDTYRRTGRLTQTSWRDAVGVLRACSATLDRNALRVAARRAKLHQLLDKAQREAWTAEAA